MVIAHLFLDKEEVFVMENAMAWVAILAVYLGFAGVLGAIIAGSQSERAWLASVYSLLVFLPASLGLPWAWPFNLLAWAAALAVAALFARRPTFIPGWVWEARFAFAYFGTVMFLIWVWTLLFTGPVLWLGLGAPAVLAGILGVRRALSGGKSGSLCTAA
jgi:lysylphosphatidylglycerol synthetase-like protein (DUF2156 family)